MEETPSPSGKKSIMANAFLVKIQKDLLKRMSKKENAAMKLETIIGEENNSEITLLENPLAKAELQELRIGDQSLIDSGENGRRGRSCNQGKNIEQPTWGKKRGRD